MSNNYIIKTESGDYFGGWSRLGKIAILPPTDRNLAYRMSNTLAKKVSVKLKISLTSIVL